MVRTIAADERLIINLAPATLIEEVLQNVAMIISTVKGTAPLHRDFGISATALDMPIAAAQSILIADIFDAIEMYEPRAEVVSVTFKGDGMAGILIPVLEVRINEG